MTYLIKKKENFKPGDVIVGWIDKTGHKRFSKRVIILRKDLNRDILIMTNIGILDWNYGDSEYLVLDL